MDELFRLLEEIAQIAGTSIECSLKLHSNGVGKLLFDPQTYFEPDQAGSLYKVIAPYPDWAHPQQLQENWSNTELGVSQLKALLKKAENYREMPLLESLQVALDSLDRRPMSEEVQAAYCTLKKLLVCRNNEKSQRL